MSISRLRAAGAAAPFALLLLFPALPAQTPRTATPPAAGKLLVRNLSDQNVTVELDRLTDARGRKQTGGTTWSILPRQVTWLTFKDRQVVASEFVYSLHTAAGRTPADPGRVWIARHKKGEVLEVVIRATALAPRKKAHSRIPRAWHLVEKPSVAPAINFFMHPTTELRRLEYTGCNGVMDSRKKEVPGHFALRYRFHWKGALTGEQASTRLAFLFDAEGDFYQLVVEGDGGLFPPFGAADLVIDTMKDAILDNLPQEDRATRLVVSQLIKRADAKGLLEVLLKTEQRPAAAADKKS